MIAARLAAALRARGWIVDYSGTVVRMRSASDKPPGASAAACAGRAAAGRSRAAGGQSELGRGRMKQGPDQIALPLDWPQSEGDAPLHRLGRQPRGVRSFPQVEHVAGQGDDPYRTAPFGPDVARSKLRRAGRRAPVRRSRAARRGGAVPRVEPGAGYWTPAGHGRRRGAAGLVAAAARPQDSACGHAGRRASATPTMRCSRR